MSRPAYTLLRAGERLKLADAVPLAAPLTIYLEPTNICNFKCTYCPVHLDDYFERSGGKSKLDLESCKRIYEEILILGRLRTLNLYMLGEPFANRDLPLFIDMAKRMSVADRVIVTTNASLLDEKTALRTIESGLDYLRVSVYGATASRMKSVTGSNIPLDRVVKNITYLKQTRDALGRTSPHIYVKMIDPGDEAERRQFIETFGPISDETAIEPAMNWNTSQDLIDFTTSGQSPSGNSHDVKGKSACPFPFYTLVINSDFRVTVCCVDWEKGTEVGNLKEQSLREIWHGQPLHDFRMTHLRGQRASIDACRSCSYLDTSPDNLDALTPEAFEALSASRRVVESAAD